MPCHNFLHLVPVIWDRDNVNWGQAPGLFLVYGGCDLEFPGQFGHLLRLSSRTLLAVSLEPHTPLASPRPCQGKIHKHGAEKLSPPPGEEKIKLTTVVKVFFITHWSRWSAVLSPRSGSGCCFFFIIESIYIISLKYVDAKNCIYTCMHVHVHVWQWHITFASSIPCVAPNVRVQISNKALKAPTVLTS